MVDIFFGVSVLRYELGVICIVSSNRFRIVLGQHTQAKVAYVATGGKM